MDLQPWELDLIKAVTQSSVFRRHDALFGELLRYLARHSGPNERHLRTEPEIRKRVFKDLATATIPVYVSRLKSALESYFSGEEGQHHERRVDIISGQGTERDPLHYAVIFPPNDFGQRFSRLFWRPHLDLKTATHIAYGLPLFTRTLDHEVFTRRIDENVDDRETAAKHPGERLCWPYVTLGDVLSTIELTKWLSDHGVRVSSQRYTAASKVSDLLKQGGASEKDNVIVVGSTRVNGVLTEYQRRGGMHYRLRLRDVEVGDGVVINEERQRDQSTVPVVVSRTRGSRHGAVTMIAANHGAAVHRVSEILRTEELLRPESGGLFMDTRLQGWVDNWPEKFQILLSLVVQDDETYTGTATVVDVWTPPTPSKN